MKRQYILAIDQGTTGTRAFIFDDTGSIVTSAYKEFTQYFPKPGWVEHDADEIWNSCCDVIKKALKQAHINKNLIKAIGITNQRETTVVWDRKTSKPIHKAIVWQCRRTADACQRLKRHEPKFKRKTGLVLDPYFSGTKISWILDNVKGARSKAKQGKIAFGTIDSWLIWKLTNGNSHVTDYTNASRTLIFNIRQFKWDKELLRILNVPQSVLPKVQQSGSTFGYTEKNSSGLPTGIPITGVLGDQQAALYGQGCFEPGTVKNTYGTGCFIVLNTGKKFIASKQGLLTTIASDDKGRPVYAMEGSIFIGGAVIQWLRDQLQFVQKASDSEKLIKGLKDTAGVYVVPAFAGLGAPFWNADARGIIVGLTRGANIKHITRAALESIAYQTKDVFDIMKRESRRSIKELKVDGGATANDFLMQFQADILKCSIVRPKVTEATAQGAAFLAGVTVGLWKGKKDLKKLAKTDKMFRPKMKDQKRKTLCNGWSKAVRQTQVQ